MPPPPLPTGTPGHLLAYRFACFAWCLALGALQLRRLGPWVLTFATVWNWWLLTLYFGFASTVSAKAGLLWRGGPAGRSWQGGLAEGGRAGEPAGAVKIEGEVRRQGKGAAGCFRMCGNLLNACSGGTAAVYYSTLPCSIPSQRQQVC